MSFTIGSLFDGSGGFPLAAFLCGGTPVWASEIEPYPIAVTLERFPYMKHLGSVTDVRGDKIEPVDVITFGSPCQDLSVAGKRAGLKHEANGDDETTRSGLFMEAIRIIKEMRKSTDGRYPTFALWENVPGAFSSNKGEDFRVVLEELIKIVEPAAAMPAVPKGGWPYADCYCGDGWSLAYRVLDAQHWGVPQRRKRVFLVLDLGGERAGEVLFEREGLRGDFEPGRTTRQGAAADSQGGAGADDRAGNCLTPWDTQNRRVYGVDGVYPTLQSMERSGQNQQAVCYDARGNGDGNTANTLTGDHQNRITDYTAVVCEPIPINDKATRYKGGGKTRNADGSGNGLGVGAPGDPANTLTAGDRHAVCCMWDGSQTAPTLTANNANGAQRMPDKDNYNCVIQSQERLLNKAAVYVDTTHADDVVRTDAVTAPLQQRDHKGGKLVLTNYIVRRLTPTECARLQGFPDTWGRPDKKDSFTDEEHQFWLEVRNTHAAINGKTVKDYTKPQMLTWYNRLHTDSSEYKMWGNGIALPCALYVMQGIADQLD